MILGGDFRKIFPVMKNGTSEMIIKETIKFLALQKHFKFFKLSKNMRASDNKFCKFLLNIGDGNIKNFKILDEWKTFDICSKIYGDILIENDAVIEHVYLSVHNQNKDKINKKYL